MKRALRMVVVLSAVALLALAISGCIIGTDGIKAAGGGQIDSLAGNEALAAFGFSVQITAEPTMTSQETEMVDARGRFQLVDMHSGFILNARITQIVYCADDGGAYPEQAIIFGGIADRDRSTEDDDLNVAVLACYDEDEMCYRLQISVADQDGNEIYANDSVVRHGRIRIWSES